MRWKHIKLEVECGSLHILILLQSFAVVFFLCGLFFGLFLAVWEPCDIWPSQYLLTWAQDIKLQVPHACKMFLIAQNSQNRRLSQSDSRNPGKIHWYESARRKTSASFRRRFTPWRKCLHVGLFICFGRRIVWSLWWVQENGQIPSAFASRRPQRFSTFSWRTRYVSTDNTELRNSIEKKVWELF